ncbi:DegT/DnrJ/EryC1/StrS aminotransferase family protein [Adlercreutzia sp. ZJ242]|uniref:DegT/DnrJ/EryC1/StrS family aminotransferase n=1 Tax=Adlercreutzia sp. ZJ242 TaxID=2709409 RepID=UPI001F150C17|nr:DegT/DnrJ/EryC1/StrS family aminotransferase [Adlercreutzia sp. ZJ242]
MRMQVPFSPPDVTEAEIAEVADALRSGWITTGPRVKELERRLKGYLRADGCCCLSSQTACAEMALRVLGVGPGDEVIAPAYTYTASASVACHVGATLVLVDCQPGSLEMDYGAVEAAVSERTKAIVPVDLGGVPCDYDAIFQVAEARRGAFRPAGEVQEALGRVAVCADAAHALGATRRGEPVGSVADFSSFSFHAVKNLTTAEGGCLTWRSIPGVEDAEMYRRLQLLSLHGQSKDALAKTELGAWEYDVVGPWYKCNMTDVAAAIGLVQLGRYPGMLARRREIIERYDAALEPLGIEPLPHYAEGHLSSGHLYICRVPGIDAGQRSALIAGMAERGVACNVHYKPLPMMTAYRNLGFDIADYPNAYARFANEVTLPLHTCLTDEQVEYVIECFAEEVRSLR